MMGTCFQEIQKKKSPFRMICVGLCRKNEGKGEMPSQQNRQLHQETSKEEIANSISHGIGTLLSIAGLVLLLL
jgi:hypothetical protein